mmetsp:Transcript_10358/g.25085  ORF Transcript_10358/g.25085 Transcript_10358/m.25085 type:complete len:373 (+) Transcript_10358:522-1640(+)
MLITDENGSSSPTNSNKPNLTVDTTSANNDNEHRSPATPNGIRGSKDLRSPGMPKSPAAQTVPIPDFITQTDANGNAVTPRSAHAIESARKSKTNVASPESKYIPASGRGVATADDDSISKDTVEETCDTLVESLRMMCCCLASPEVEESTGADNKITSKETLESEDNAESTIVLPKLLGSIHPNDAGKKCLVLDLDETLVHSSFRAVEGADFVIPVKIEDVVHFVYVAKRPGVDDFLLEMSKHYEIVIYTASLNKYADPLLDLLDIHKVIRYRLFRESCVFFEGNYVKDLSVLDRDISSTIIIDNSPNSYLFHPENAIDCSSFIDDPRDRELDQIGSFLTGIKDAKDVRGLAPQWRDWPMIDPIEEEETER